MTPAEPSEPRPLSSGEFTAVSVTAGAVGALGLLGFVISFATIAKAAEPAFGALAFLVPLGIDLGIAIFSALDIVLARLDMRLRWLRFIPWSLVAATIYLNVAGQTSMVAIVAHAVLPALWVVAVEVGAHVLRKRAKLSNPERMDTVRLTRWLLSPAATLLLWRRMVLWEIRSYPAALGRERDRILAKTDLQDRYGALLWRWRAPRRDRALYRLGELAPHTLTGTVQVPAAPPRRELPAAPDKPATGRRKSRSGGTRAGRKPYTRPADVDDLMPLGWRIAADHEQRGLPLTRDRLRDAVREAGQTISTDRAGALLKRLRTEPPADPTDQEVTS